MEIDEGSSEKVPVQQPLELRCSRHPALLPNLGPFPKGGESAAEPRDEHLPPGSLRLSLAGVTPSSSRLGKDFEMHPHERSSAESHGGT